YGMPGDELWVRETHAIYPTHGQHRTDDKRWGPWDGLPVRLSPDRTQIAYFREGFDRSDPGHWKPSIHMPRWASRIRLTVTEVRVERVQSISEADAIAEGIERHDEYGVTNYGPLGNSHCDPLYEFRRLWRSINDGREGC